MTVLSIVIAPQALRDEVFPLKDINAIGKPVEHPVGLAIPKLIEVQMPKPGDFAQFRGQIEKDYIDAKATELMQAARKSFQTLHAYKAVWKRPQKRWA